MEILKIPVYFWTGVLNFYYFWTGVSNSSFGKIFDLFLWKSKAENGRLTFGRFSIVENFRLSAIGNCRKSKILGKRMALVWINYKVVKSCWKNFYEENKSKHLTFQKKENSFLTTLMNVNSAPWLVFQDYKRPLLDRFHDAGYCLSVKKVW